MNQRLTLDRALQCIQKGIAKARELGFNVAITVVDDTGHLVASQRMDGALWITPEFARAKANASAAFRATTLDLEQRFKERPFFVDSITAMSSIGPYQFVIGRGGVPIVEGGEVVGAVGVSGAVPPDHDHAIADAAAGHPAVPKGH